MNQPLIKLEGVKKVFLTDEVETHALVDVHFEIDRKSTRLNSSHSS